jgi:aspartyl/asparaginyl beta-hydroxylase (cupin superfamily)
MSNDRSNPERVFVNPNSSLNDNTSEMNQVFDHRQVDSALTFLRDKIEKNAKLDPNETGIINQIRALADALAEKYGDLTNQKNPM